jgi:3-methyladenine DNA glycosylase Mpg
MEEDLIDLIVNEYSIHNKQVEFFLKNGSEIYFQSFRIIKMKRVDVRTNRHKDWRW